MGFKKDGSQFDHLFEDGEKFSIGNLNCEYIFTPGHTPACGSYKIEENIFVGDTLFMHDFGTARCDFPGGDARDLYKSIRRILNYPEDTNLCLLNNDRKSIYKFDRNIYQIDNKGESSMYKWKEPFVIHMGFSKQEQNMEDKSNYYLNRGEAETRKDTTEARASWFTSIIPDKCKVRFYKGKLPEVLLKR